MDLMSSTPPEIDWTLPADLLLEITARSDIRTLVRCAALCKLLRRDILDPSFIRRVTSDIVGDCYPVTSRGGLLLLRRHLHVRSSRRGLCVYDPITGHRTFLSKPPGIPYNSVSFHKCVLLMATDGIDCSLLIFVGSLNTSFPRAVIVQIFTSLTNTWGPILTHGDFAILWLEVGFDAVVLHGGVIHWLTHDGGKILTYDVCIAMPGILELPVFDPATPKFKGGQLHLGSYSSPDGHMLLRLLVVVGSTMSVWHHLPCGGWVLETMTDMEDKLRLLDPSAPPEQPLEIWFMLSGERSNVILLHMRTSSMTILLDLETEEMHVTRSAPSATLLEIDMPSWLRAMTIFS
uniref:F-box domain-containing protein n=1 Tax=Aegilops tauschii TaxID=37682 RepID=R7WCU2_AEGTA